MGQDQAKPTQDPQARAGWARHSPRGLPWGQRRATGAGQTSVPGDSERRHQGEGADPPGVSERHHQGDAANPRVFRAVSPEPQGQFPGGERESSFFEI